MSYVLKQAGYIVSFSPCKTLRAIVTIFFSNFFQSSFSDGKFTPSHLYLFIKGLIFVVLSEFVLFLNNLTWLLHYTERIFLSFLLVKFIVAFFLPNQENLYMIHHDSKMLYCIYNTINELDRRQIHYFSLILNYLDILSDLKSFSITSSVSWSIIISMLSLFECIARSSSLPIEEFKLFDIVNWIFLVSNVLRLVIMSFKYGIISLSNSSTESVLFYFYYHHFRIQYHYYSKNYLLLLIYYNIFFFMPQNLSK